MLTVPLLSRARSDALVTAKKMATLRSRASTPYTRTEREDPTNWNALTSVPGAQEVTRPIVLHLVVEISSTAPAAGLNSAEFNALDAWLNIANVGHVELLQQFGRFRRIVEEAQLGEFSREIGMLRQRTYKVCRVSDHQTPLMTVTAKQEKVFELQRFETHRDWTVSERLSGIKGKKLMNKNLGLRTFPHEVPNQSRYNPKKFFDYSDISSSGSDSETDFSCSVSSDSSREEDHLRRWRRSRSKVRTTTCCAVHSRRRVERHPDLK